MRKARKRVEEKKGFYGHLSVYLSVAIFFFTMNLVTWDGKLWFFFPLLPWGIGLLIHYFTVFGLPFNQVLSPDWEEKEFAKELQRLRNKHEITTPETDDEFLDLKSEEEALPKKSRIWKEDDLV